MTVSRDNFTRLFSLTISFWSYKRYCMRILNVAEFSRCYSTIKDPCRCRLHRWVWTPLCSLRWGVGTPLCSLRRGVGTHRCSLHRQVWTPWCCLHWQVWTPWCSLHRRARSPVCPTQGSPQKFSVLTVTRRCRMHHDVWTLRCRLHRRVWTHQCRLHRPVQAPRCSLHRWVNRPTLKACQCSKRNNSSQIRLWVSSTGYWEEILVWKNFLTEE